MVSAGCAFAENRCGQMLDGVRWRVHGECIGSNEATDKTDPNPPTKMKTITRKDTIAKIRASLGVKRLDPRRLFAIYDGAYTWIGDRADLDAKDARDLRAINVRGCRPDRNGPETTDGIDYNDVCRRVPCIASDCGAGIVAMENLPEDWRDGSALGGIAPL